MFLTSQLSTNATKAAVPLQCACSRSDWTSAGATQPDDKEVRCVLSFLNGIHSSNTTRQLGAPQSLHKRHASVALCISDRINAAGRQPKRVCCSTATDVALTLSLAVFTRTGW